MSTAAVPDLPDDPSHPARGTRRIVTFHQRHAWILGLAPWAAAATVLGLHAAGSAFPDFTRFAFLVTYLLILGCVGCPNAAIRSLGCRASTEVCRLIAAVFASAGAVITGLILIGQMHPRPGTAVFTVIYLMAAALQTANAAEAEGRMARREVLARQRGRVEALAGAIEQRRAALAGFDRLEELHAASEMSGGRHAPITAVGHDATILQLPAGGGANGHRRH